MKVKHLRPILLCAMGKDADMAKTNDIATPRWLWGEAVRGLRFSVDPSVPIVENRGTRIGGETSQDEVAAKEAGGETAQGIPSVPSGPPLCAGFAVAGRKGVVFFLSRRTSRQRETAAGYPMRTAVDIRE
jgi:hypothetical protein